MSDTPSVSLVCCDLVSVAFDGTIVERAFTEAIATQGIVTGTEAYVRSMVRFDRTQGCPPADVMRDLFAGDEPRVLASCLAFERSFRAAADRFCITPPPDAAAALGKIAESGVRVCLMSGLSRSSSKVVADRLGSLAGLGPVLCADDAPRGFPWPDLALTASLRLGVGDVRELAMVSATESGIQCGRRAGAGVIVGMLTGSRTARALRRAGATHVLDSFAALPDLVLQEAELHKL
ncbi:MAG: haloacid dehalogenase [Streptosporangiaceae bacterium]|nr:haloacid dehalogenase [Streptosporangiaceae bacterium]MBV9853053.1 haloacid dehalogenase [Streptosporangiaceae bacterium]